ncbi:hypothetical protein DTO013E5_10231 [Penicillium roqueforti]|uniref:Str. FM013 n=1 Tax=Penicillium camemberti (strain FM 013) TaxID=1429867 RepID=A0A0G4PXW0_PENC3|nr:hypothetical protein DTO013F2_10507 [Penicillium roqueforti]CAG8018017.1 unnamed protein product [Penicillium salamii]CRL30974.1 unnamed protein product [Penicillium camemberti]KAI2734029.1 hypothetical protein DTO012A1_10263 [Penicillium roqueforti]KAI3195037.1 hypothetical protein DTO013E5_10231 [Penicillium roqueforti]
MSSQHRNTGNGRKPFPILRPPSTTVSNLANPTTPPDRATPHRNVQEEFLISTTYSTIAARALSFQGQVLSGVTPLQLAQNGFHYQPYPSSGGLACCFACQSAKRLDDFRREPFQDTQQLHVGNCIWEVVYGDLKQHLESADILPLSTNAPPPPRQSTPKHHHASTEREPLKKTITDASTQTRAQSTPTTPTTRVECPNSNVHSRAQPSSATIDSELQTPPPIYSPQPPQPMPSIISSPLTQQTTYSSVLQQSIPVTSQSASPTQEPILPAAPILTIEDLHRRFHNKPPPFKLENKISQRSTRQIRNNSASATQSLSRFLVSALPAFSRFLAEVQPKADSCCPSHSHIYHSRAMKAA